MRPTKPDTIIEEKRTEIKKINSEHLKIWREQIYGMSINITRSFQSMQKEAMKVTDRG